MDYIYDLYYCTVLVDSEFHVNNPKKVSLRSLKSMPLEKLQEMINQKLNEAKHKYSAVMKYSITTNWSQMQKFWIQQSHVYNIFF